MSYNLADFYRINRNIFGICKTNGTLFRLSDVKIFLRAKPKQDWMDEIDEESVRLDAREERLQEREQEIREEARRKGRAFAFKSVKKIDPVFSPRGLDAQDAKVLFHPVDYVVFNGIKSGPLRNILLLDRQVSSSERLGLQRSIARVIEKGNYEWLTIRIRDDGRVTEE